MSAPRVDIASLNPEQRAAVLHRGTPLLLLAGAGSGKTRVITTRIAYLLETGVPPTAILGVTFTNKAAQEMRARIRSMVKHDPEAARAVTLSTFHALGVAILRESGRRVGVRKRFTILDSEDQFQIVRDILDDHNIDPKVLPPPVAANRLSRAKNEGFEPEDLRKMARSHGERAMAAIATAYDEHLQRLGALDFDDLLRYPLRLLRDHEDVRDSYRRRFQHVLVDEYQDSNKVQLELVQALVGPGENLVVVGDDDQSIYGWRGACVDNILSFERHFSGATAMNLTQNYRSTGNVLALANHVVALAKNRRPKELWTQGDDGDPVTIVTCRTPTDEASFIAADIVARSQDEGRPWGDFGLLYRTNGQARFLEDGLREAGVPYRLVGGTSFYERREVKDVLAYLRLVVNPRDELALRRALGAPARGIGGVSMGRFLAWSQERKEPVLSALRHADQVPKTPLRIVKAARGFAEMIDAATDEFENGGDLAGTAERLVKTSGLRQSILENVGVRKPSAARFILDNITSLIESLREYESRAAEPTILGFMQKISLQSGSDDGEDPEKATLMTLHSAKGLEFPVVYLAGVEEGLIPHGRSMEEVGGEDDEERRLFYVGITRAQKVLTMTRCRTRSRFDGEYRPKPSRFLGDVPDRLLTYRGRADIRRDPSKKKERQAAGFAALFDALK